MTKTARPMRILFADDETSLQELMRIELPRLGHEATVCPDGRTAIDSDAWCEVDVDGVPRGRFASRRVGLRFPAPAGRHVVTCAQPGTARRWSAEVEVEAGQVAIAAGTLLRRVRVTIAVVHGDGATIDAGHFRNGDVTELAARRYNVAVTRGAAVEQRAYVDLPQVEACTIRDEPALACYP